MDSHTISLGSATIDIPVLLRTRMLIQANSGGGKSWLLRRIAEQLYGKVQVIIVDPEGEFSTLREKFDYVLVGAGGETPADPRSAALVAEKLLELRASAVCDLFEAFRKTPQSRHLWVKTFCNALLDAPKKLWHPMILIIDEFHKFVPERGAGESEASEAVIGIGTAGRKRGYCLIGATQRLGKVRKDVSAELLNRMVGPTFEDIDLDRAADLLSVSHGDRQKFFGEMRVLEPGNFYALGRAICKERTLVKVGPVKTTHPEIGSSTFAVGPPPTPERIKALLPKLADLPKEAEDRARTTAEMKKRIRELEMQLRAKPIAASDEGAIARAMKRAEAEAMRKASVTIRALESALTKQQATMKRAAEQLIGSAVNLPKIWQAPALDKTPDFSRLVVTPARQVETQNRRKVSSEPSAEGITNPEQRILDAIAWMESLGIDTPEQPAVSFLAGYRFGGGAFNNPRGSLRTKGLVEYVGDRIRLTDTGRATAHQVEETLTDEELHRRVMGRLPSPEQRLLRPLIEAYPEALSNDRLAELSGYAANSGGFNNPRGRLRTLGLIEYVGGGLVKARPLLFPSQING